MANNEVERAQWSGKLDFIMSALGFAVGLGNIWRFPYLAYRNGGGAFLLPYFLFVGVLAIPLIIMEGAVGQYTSLGVISMWRLLPIGKGIGYGVVLVMFYFATEYNTPITYSAFYLINSFKSPLPWTVSHLLTPSEDFFFNRVLQVSSGIDDVNLFRWELYIVNAVTWFIIYLVICKGAATLGKVAYVTSFLPYILLTAILIKASLLPGSANGVYFYLNPKWEVLAKPQVWKDAMACVFLSTGLGTGGIIALSSYNKFNNNFLRDCLMLPILDSLTGLFAGFCVFTVLGYLAEQTGKPIEEVVRGGPGLIFITYPEALATMPGANAWSALFFLTCIILGLSSQFPHLETISNALLDEYPTLRKREWLSRGLIVLVVFATSTIFYTDAGYYYFHLFEDKVVCYPVMLFGLFEMLALIWLYGGRKILEHTEVMIGHVTWPKEMWLFLARFCAPAMIPIIFLWDMMNFSRPELLDSYYPTWSWVLGSSLSLSTILCIPAYVIYKLLRGHSLSSLLQPDKEWLAEQNLKISDHLTSEKELLDITDKLVSNEVL